MDSDASPSRPRSGRRTRRGVSAPPPARRAPHPRRVRRAISRARRADPRALPGPRVDRGAQAHARGPRRPVGRRRAKSSSRPAPAVGLRRLGDYTLLRELGRGGMGIVYEAEHESLKNRVALKVMHPRFRADRAYVRRFQTEARSAAKLHHTNIVPVFDYGEQDGVCYYAMQCIVRSRPGAGAGGCPPPPGRGQPRHRGRDRRRGTRDGDRRGCGPAHGHLPRPADRPVRGCTDGFPRRRVGRDGDRRRPTARPPAPGRARRIGLRPIRRRSGVEPAARLPANPSRSISARSPAWAPRSPTRWTTPTARG